MVLDEARLFAATVADTLVLITTDMVFLSLIYCDYPSSPRVLIVGVDRAVRGKCLKGDSRRASGAGKKWTFNEPKPWPHQMQTTA
jgi:hypothetical protein